MECSKCPCSRDVSAGVYADTPWDETPCSACLAAGRPGAVCLASGKRHVPLDETRAVSRDAPCGEDAEVSGGGGEMPVSVLADAVRLLMRLPRDVLEVFRLRYRGVRYREIARELGIGRSACSMMLVRALADHPALLELLPRTKGRRERRRAPAGRPGGERRKAARRGPSPPSGGA